MDGRGEERLTMSFCSPLKKDLKQIRRLRIEKKKKGKKKKFYAARKRLGCVCAGRGLNVYKEWGGVCVGGTLHISFISLALREFALLKQREVSQRR